MTLMFQKLPVSVHCNSTSHRLPPIVQALERDRGEEQLQVTAKVEEATEATFVIYT